MYIATVVVQKKLLIFVNFLTRFPRRAQNKCYDLTRSRMTAKS